MATAAVITGCLNTIVLALTPLQRWEAAGRFDTGFMLGRWFTITMVVIIIALTTLLFLISYKQTAKEQKSTGQLFSKYADKRGLSGRDRQMLLDISAKAGLRRIASIFTMRNAFDRGVAKMIKESTTEQGVEQGSRLRAEVSFLREKLGFKKRNRISIGSTGKPKKISSRQIPVGKKLHITNRKTSESGSIESTVIKNDDMELMVQLARPVETAVGDFWRGRYYFGTSVWEFDTYVVGCNGNILTLNHNDKVRFINRRRFLRTSVIEPAFIARFPFKRTVLESDESDKDAQKSDITWGPPEFVAGVVTELGGPGLRIEAPIEVNVGDKVLVVFRLDEEKDEDLTAANQNGKAPTSKIIEDIGEVRHTKAIENGLSIAVELTGLSDPDINELVCFANTVSLNSVGSQGIPGFVSNEQTEKYVGKAAAAQ